MRSRLLLALALLVAAPLTLAAQHEAAHHQPGQPHEEPTVVIFVRHGERGTTPANDPTLTPAGEQRALALVEALRAAKVQVVLHTPRVRTRDTALPVARHFGLTPEIVPLAPGRAHIDSLAAAVRRHAGKTILVVGHSNTIMPYIAALGGPQRADLCDHQYEGLYVLTMIHGNVSLIEGRYGAPNPPATEACASMMAPPARP